MIGLREDQQMKARMIDYLNHATGLCGSWLACDGGLSVDTSLADPPLSQASQLPQGLGCHIFFCELLNIWDANLYIEMFQKIGL